MTRVIRIEWAQLAGKRPRAAGPNSRVSPAEAPALGADVRLPLARLTLADGSSGFGYSHVTEAQARALLGSALDSLFDAALGARDEALPIEYPLWDLAARRAGVPVYALASGGAPPTSPAAPASR